MIRKWYFIVSSCIFLTGLSYQLIQRNIITITFARHYRPSTNEGFDFSVRKGFGWSGPDLNSQVELSSFRDNHGVSLAQIVNDTNRPIMVMVVKAGCGITTLSVDQMLFIRDSLKEIDIPYYLICPSTSRPNSAYQYMHKLNLDVPNFVRHSSEQVLESLATMVSPSHLLLAPDGRILSTWPGLSSDKLLRDKMSNQIILDTKNILNSHNSSSLAMPSHSPSVVLTK